MPLHLRTGFASSNVLACSAKPLRRLEQRSRGTAHPTPPAPWIERSSLKGRPPRFMARQFSNRCRRSLLFLFENDHAIIPFGHRETQLVAGQCCSLLGFREIDALLLRCAG